MMRNIYFHNGECIFRFLAIGVLAYLALIAMLGTFGKRKLSQMKEFDFIVTVSLDSILAAILLNRDVFLTKTHDLIF